MSRICLVTRVELSKPFPHVVTALQDQAPPPDVEYYLFERKKNLDMLASGNDTVLALQRVQMEELRAECDVLFVRVKEKQVSAV